MGVMSAAPGLRDVQLALAREYGLPGWTALRQALDDLTLAQRSHVERVEIVLRSATWGGDRIAAARILTRWPEISSDNLYTAVATGNLDEVERRLSADPAAAVRRRAVDWEPLLYLTYARLPGDESHALDIADALLDCGADPNARWLDDWHNRSTVLTGVIGQGEGDQPPHPHAASLSRLLIERGRRPLRHPGALQHLPHARRHYLVGHPLDPIRATRICWLVWRAVPETSKHWGRRPLNALDYLLATPWHTITSSARMALIHGATPTACTPIPSALSARGVGLWL